MRCVACDHDSKKKDRKVEGRCPKCGHRFALDPEVDGIADSFMKQAIVAVSSNDTFKYLPAQLHYEVWRRSRPPTAKQRSRLSLILISVLVTGILILFLMALSGLNIHPFFYYLTIALTFLSLVMGYGASPVSNRRPKNPEAALRRYETVNPPTNKLGPAPKLDPAPYRPALKFLEGPVLSGQPHLGSLVASKDVQLMTKSDDLEL